MKSHPGRFVPKKYQLAGDNFVSDGVTWAHLEIFNCKDDIKSSLSYAIYIKSPTNIFLVCLNLALRFLINRFF